MFTPSGNHAPPGIDGGAGGGGGGVSRGTLSSAPELSASASLKSSAVLFSTCNPQNPHAGRVASARR